MIVKIDSYMTNLQHPKDNIDWFKSIINNY